MLVEVTFVRDARSVTQITPETPIAPDNVVAGAFIRDSRAVFSEGILTGHAGATRFIELLDVPSTYAGAGGRLVAVTTGESGLEFIPPPTPPASNFLALTDTPDSYAGAAGKLPAVNSGESGLEFILPPSASNFLALADTPDSYSGFGGYFVAVLNDESGLRFTRVGGGTRLLSGGGVVWTGTGLVFTVAAAHYIIAGVEYFSLETNITLAAADPTNDRIDVVAVNTSSSAVVVTGTPGGPPVEPSVDPSTQLKLSIIYVPAGATVPVITNQDIYRENTEWTSSTNSGNINLASTNNPHAGTKDIEGTATVAGNQFTLVKPSGTLKLSDYTSLVFSIRSKAAWPAPKSISIDWRNGASVVGVPVVLDDGIFGFNSGNITAYQLIVIPASTFNTGDSLIDRIRFTIAGGGAAIGWYIDDIFLQAGTTPPPSAGGDFSTNTNVSVAGEMVLFADTTGKLGKRSTGSGYVKLVSGVPTPVALIGGLAFGDQKTAGITTGKRGGFWTSPYAGTITGWSLTVDAGTITIKIWKIANGTAKPTAANSINTSGLSLSSGTHIRSAILTDFTTLAVAIGDVFAVEVIAASGVTDFAGTVEITRS